MSSKRSGRNPGLGHGQLPGGHFGGTFGSVVGVDFTPAQVDKARALATQAGITNVEFLPGRIEALPAEDAGFDLVISNGVINLSAEKARCLPRPLAFSVPAGGW